MAMTSDDDLIELDLSRGGSAVIADFSPMLLGPVQVEPRVFLGLSTQHEQAEVITSSYEARQGKSHNLSSHNDEVKKIRIL